MGQQVFRRGPGQERFGKAWVFKWWGADRTGMQMARFGKARRALARHGGVGLGKDSLGSELVRQG